MRSPHSRDALFFAIYELVIPENIFLVFKDKEEVVARCFRTTPLLRYSPTTKLEFIYLVFLTYLQTCQSSDDVVADHVFAIPKFYLIALIL